MVKRQRKRVFTQREAESHSLPFLLTQSSPSEPLIGRRHAGCTGYRPSKRTLQAGHGQRASPSKNPFSDHTENEDSTDIYVFLLLRKEAKEAVTGLGEAAALGL